MAQQSPPKPGEIAQPEPKAPMRVLVKAGQDSVNVIRKKNSNSPIIQVLDGDNRPLAGAAVEFTSPADGPSITFSNGLRSISVLTDSSGCASFDEWKPLGVGAFQINVSASFRSLSGTATISMKNQASATHSTAVGANRGSGISGKTIAILAGVGAAAAVAIAVGLSHHGAASAANSPSTSATIGLGSGGSVGAPH